MKTFIKNEYGPLISCLVAYPCNIQIIDINNVYIGRLDKSLAITQYNDLINTLIKHNVKVQFLNLNGSPAQIFTRDIGFVIEDILFISNMTDPIRQSEIQPLIDLAKTHNMKVHLMSHKVEGGDIIFHGDKIFVGLGNRTSERAVEEISTVLNNHNINCTIIKVQFDTSKIHLDCVFNTLDKNTCLISKGVFNSQDITKHFANIIDVPENEVDSLAANIINLGNNNLLCSNENLNVLLNHHGYRSVYIEFNEVIKAGGSIGCCIFPIHRGEI